MSKQESEKPCGCTHTHTHTHTRAFRGPKIKIRITRLCK